MDGVKVRYGTNLSAERGPIPHQESNADAHNHVRRGAILKLGESAHAKALGVRDLPGRERPVRADDARRSRSSRERGDRAAGGDLRAGSRPAVQVGGIRAELEFWPEDMLATAAACLLMADAGPFPPTPGINPETRFNHFLPYLL